MTHFLFTNYNNFFLKTFAYIFSFFNWLNLSGCKKFEGGVKDRTMSLFETNTTKRYSKSRGANNMYGSQKKLRKSKIKK